MTTLIEYFIRGRISPEVPIQSPLEMSPASPITVTYEVREDPQRKGRWIVLRGGVPTGAFARDQRTAVGAAYAVATKEAQQTHLKIRVISVVGRARTLEWRSP